MRYLLAIATLTFTLSVQAETPPICSKIFSQFASAQIPNFEGHTRGRWGFRSPMVNRLKLWWNDKNLYEISNVAVRTQCFGTCYLYGAQPALETAMRSTGHLQEGDYLVGFIPLLKIAWMRHQKKPNETIDLDALISGGHVEGFAAVNKGPSFYLDKATVKKLGGPDKIAQLEAALVDSIISKPWLFWRSPEVQRLLNSDFESFLQRAQTLMERRLSRSALSKVSLRSISYGDVQISYTMHPMAFPWQRTGYFTWKGSPEAFDRDRMPDIFNTLLGNSPPAELDGVSVSQQFHPILKSILGELAESRAVWVAIRSLFDDRTGYIPHAISLTGAVIDRKTGNLKGFKYVNSWGKEHHIAGFSYISRDELQNYFVGAVIPTRLPPHLQSTAD